MEAAGHQSDPLLRRRLRWRAKRGLLENDVVLERFLERHETDLADDEVAALSALLDLPDNDLLDLILRRSEPVAPLDTEPVARVVALLRAA